MFLRMSLVCVILATTVVMALPIRAHASSYTEYLLTVAFFRFNTLGGVSETTEDNGIRAEYARYLREQERLRRMAGQAFMDGQFPTNVAAPGASVTLSFGFVDTSTGLPTSLGPQVGSVEYEANLDPSFPDVFVPLGTSSNAGSNFGLPFTITGFEPMIQAIPFDASGSPIVIDGVDGDNIAMGLVTALSIPEPSAFVLCSIGLVAAMFRKKGLISLLSHGEVSRR